MMTLFIIIGVILLLDFLFGGDKENPRRNTLNDKVMRINRVADHFSKGMDNFNKNLELERKAMQIMSDTKMKLYNELLKLESADRMAVYYLSSFKSSSHLSTEQVREELNSDVERILKCFDQVSGLQPTEQKIKFEFTEQIASKPLVKNPKLQELIDIKYNSERNSLDNKYAELRKKSAQDTKYATELKHQLKEQGFPNSRINLIFPVPEPTQSIAKAGNSLAAALNLGEGFIDSELVKPRTSVIARNKKLWLNDGEQ